MNRKYKTLLIDPPWNYGVWGNEVECDFRFNELSLENIQTGDKK